MNPIIKIINEEISAISKDKKKEIFDYKSVQEDSWLDPKKAAQKFQRITFDFENDDIDSKKTFYAKVNLRKDQPVKNEFNVALCCAGGDWEYPVLYFRIEFTHQYGLLNNKYQKNPEFVWDEDKKYGRKFCIIPPVEAGNKLLKGETDSGKYDWFAYQDSEMSKEDRKVAEITDIDKKSCWKWLQELLEKLVNDRHEMLD